MSDAVVCACFNGLLLDDFERTVRCDRCNPVFPKSFPDFRDGYRCPNTDGDLDTFGRPMRPGS